MPNTVAYVVLFSWPLVCVIFFRKLPLPAAIAATLVGGYLFIPVLPSIDLPLLPAINKNSVSALTAIVLAGFALNSAYQKRKVAERRGMDAEEADVILPGWLPRGPVPLGLLILFFIATMATMATNRDSIFIARGIVLPGLSLFDGMSMIMGLLVLLPPFLLGRRFFSRPEHHRQLLMVFALGGLVYSFLAMVEIRLSPQLNSWLYGFFPHSFLQHKRAGGWRPIIFLPHGLWVAVFLAMAASASMALAKSVRAEDWLKWLSLAIWIFAVLFFCNSLGGLLLAFFMLGILFVLPERMIALICGCLVLLFLFYPMLRLFGLMPLDAIVSAAAKINATRADSLGFRLMHEEWLLDKTSQKIFFGWGGWGRNLIYEPLEGKMISTVDSLWVIRLSIAGFVGYVAEFGLYAVAAIALAFGRLRAQIPMVTTGVIAVLSINLIDTLVNATSTPLTWLLAGALTGYLEAERARLKDEKRAALSRPNLARGPREVSAAAVVPNEANPPADEPLTPLNQRYSRQKVKHVRTSTQRRPIGR
ncbi:MAG: hypothetical protein AAFU56_00450 [Pseudomonadota bacterium]